VKAVQSYRHSLSTTVNRYPPHFVEVALLDVVTDEERGSGVATELIGESQDTVSGVTLVSRYIWLLT